MHLHTQVQWVVTAERAPWRVDWHRLLCVVLPQRIKACGAGLYDLVRMGWSACWACTWQGMIEFLNPKVAYAHTAVQYGFKFCLCMYLPASFLLWPWLSAIITPPSVSQNANGKNILIWVPVTAGASANTCGGWF